jgi:hypothetical protein
MMRAVKCPRSPSTSRTRRCGTIRVTIASIAAATAPIQTANKSFSSDNMAA